MSDGNGLQSINAIMSASPAAIIVTINGMDETRSWHNVTSIGSTLVAHGAGKVFVLVVAFDDARTFVVAEIEPVWGQLVDLLPTCLQNVEPITAWGPRLLSNPSAMLLYQREV